MGASQSAMPSYFAAGGGPFVASPAAAAAAEQEEASETQKAILRAKVQELDCLVAALTALPCKDTDIVEVIARRTS